MGTASATDYYVSTTGNNASDGLTISTAWQNVSYGVTQLTTPGDTLYLIDGIWYNEHINFANSGNITHPITVTAYNGTPTLDGVDKTIDQYAFHLGEDSNITLSDITIQNYQNAVYFLNSSNCTLDNMTMTANWTPGDAGGVTLVQIPWSDYITISNCTLHNASWNTITILGNTTGSPDVDPNSTHINILNNNFYDNTGHTGGFDLFGDVHYLTVTNNTFSNSAAVSFIHQSVEHNYFIFKDNIVNDCDYVALSRMRNSIVENNTFHNSTSTDMEATYPVYNLTIENNRHYNSGSWPLKIMGYDISIIDEYVYDAGKFNAPVIKVDYTNATMSYSEEYFNIYSENIFFFADDNATVKFLTTGGRVYSYSKAFGGSAYTTTDLIWDTTGGWFNVSSNDGGGYAFDVKPKNMTIMPSMGHCKNVTVNTDLVDDISNITVNVSTSCSVLMNFTVDNATNTYNLSVDNIFNYSLISGVDSIARFNYTFSSSTPTDFEVTWASTEGWNPEVNHIYFGRPVQIDTNGNVTQLGTPTQDDIDLTNIFGVRSS